MLGKTHMAVGVAAALAVLHPKTLAELVFVSGISGLGAVISDIDVGTSESHKEADKIITLAVIIMIGIGVLDYYWKLGIWNQVKSNHSIYQMVVAGIVFVGICTYGKEKPHRSFMHSFLAMGILAAVIWVIYPMAASWFVIGFLSHLALDILNYKKVQLFYPEKKGVCLRWFHAQGMANDIAFITGILVIAAEAVLFFLK